MNKPPQTKNPQKVINRYYQRFYHDRKKSTHPESLQLSNTQKRINSQESTKKQAVVFQINYETSQTINNHSKPSSQQLEIHNQNNLIAKDQDNIHKQRLNSSSPTSFFKDESFSVHKKNITFQITSSNNPEKKPSSKRKSFKLDNFDHFPTQSIKIKNQPKKKPTKDHFFTITQYSKTIDVENHNNTKFQTHNLHKTCDVSPQKHDQSFSLESFSHIQLHNSKKQSKKPRKREIIDIVKRKQQSPVPSIMSSSIMVEQQRSKSKFDKPEETRRVSPVKEGFFKDFKPKIQLKRRPSTGVPMKKNRNASQNPQKATSPTKSPNERVYNFFNTLQNAQHMNNTHSAFGHSRARSRSSKRDSLKHLSVQSKQIHLLKYIDLREDERMDDVFRNAKEWNDSQQLRNVVHLEIRKRSAMYQQNKAKRYSGNGKKASQKPEEYFLPWESTQKQDQGNQNQLINRQVELENFLSEQLLKPQLRSSKQLNRKQSNK